MLITANKAVVHSTVRAFLGTPAGEDVPAGSTHGDWRDAMRQLHCEYTAMLVSSTPKFNLTVDKFMFAEVKKMEKPQIVMEEKTNTGDELLAEVTRLWPLQWKLNTLSKPNTCHAMVCGIEVSVWFLKPHPTGYVMHKNASKFVNMPLGALLRCLRAEVEKLSREEIPPVKDEREELLDSAWTHLKVVLPEHGWAFDDAARKAARRRGPNQDVGMLLFVRYLDANLVLYMTLFSDEGRVGGKRAGTTWYVAVTGNRAVSCMSEAVDNVFAQMAGLREREEAY